MHFRLKTKTKTKSKIAAKINTGFLPVWFLYKICVSVSLGFSLAPSLMWNPKMDPVKMLRTAKVMMWLSPQHPIPTTRPHLPLLKLVVRFPFNDIYGFCGVLIVLVKCSLLYGYPKMEQVKMQTPLTPPHGFRTLC